MTHLEVVRGAMPPTRLQSYESSDSASWRDRLSLPDVPQARAEDHALPLELALRVDKFLAKHSRAANLAAAARASTAAGVANEFDFLLSVESRVGHSRDTASHAGASAQPKAASSTLGLVAASKEEEETRLAAQLARIKARVASAMAEKRELESELREKPEEWKVRLNDVAEPAQDARVMPKADSRRWSGGNSPVLARRRQGRKFASFSARPSRPGAAHSNAGEATRSKSFSAGDRRQRADFAEPVAASSTTRQHLAKSVRSASFSLFHRVKGSSEKPFIATARFFARRSANPASSST